MSSGGVAKSLRLENPDLRKRAGDAFASHDSSPPSPTATNTTTEDDSDGEYSLTEAERQERQTRGAGGSNGSFEDEDSSDLSDMSELSLAASSLSGEDSHGTTDGSPTSQTVAKIQQRRKMRQKKFMRKGQEERRRDRDAFQVGRQSDRGQMKSFFHLECDVSRGFSVQHEARCFWVFLMHLRDTIEEERLPWATDFFDLRKMRWPKGRKEALSRLNLNIPYYASNYLEIFYLITLPFLFFYNLPFFLVLVTTCVLIHSIRMRRKELNAYDAKAIILGRPVAYHTLGHALLVNQLVLFLFFNGLKTVAVVVLLNAAVVLPHALWRRTTFFDDEDMEKCRPKLSQYALTLLFLTLCYLEGAADTNEPGGKGAAQLHLSKVGSLGHVLAGDADESAAKAVRAEAERLNASNQCGRRATAASGTRDSTSGVSLASSAAAAVAQDEANMNKLLGAMERERVRKAVHA